MEKCCTRCATTQPLTAFYRNAKAPDGLYALCKTCRLAYQRTYRLAHLGDYRVRQRAYSSAYRLAHPESQRAYRQAHPESTRMYKRRRRAQKCGASVNDFTHAQWVEVQAAYGHRCVYCGKRAKGHLTQDHLTPLTKGGLHTLANIVPACQSCNSRKHTGAVLCPVQPLLLSLA